MEFHCPFMDFPVETSIHKGFAMAMFNNQMVAWRNEWTGQCDITIWIFKRGITSQFGYPMDIQGLYPLWNVLYLVYSMFGGLCRFLDLADPSFCRVNPHFLVVECQSLLLKTPCVAGWIHILCLSTPDPPLFAAFRICYQTPSLLADVWKSNVAMENKLHMIDVGKTMA